MYKVKLVGPMPRVSDRGVTFDTSKEDKYLYLGAALQLAEAFDVHGVAHDIVYRPRRSELSETQINEMLEKYCDKLDEYAKAREEKAKGQADELRRRVSEATTISEEAKKAWLKNIDMMVDYYMQYITNEAAYECVLDRLGDEIVNAKIEEIKIPMFHRFGVVLHDLMERLEKRKPPVDSEFSVEYTPDGLIGTMKLKYV